MHRTQGLPLVIARPGIVIGEGGPLQHWGIGRWHGAGAVRIWGDGHNILPFVLIDDISDALIAMIDKDEAVGQSFNLIGEPMMSARDYFDAIHQALGARIEVKKGAFWTFYLSGSVKYLLKRYVVGLRDLKNQSYSDWKSRGHLSPFSNEHTKEVLGWAPESDRDAFVRKGITEANLFGF
jgi:nucleoside-diphosphate-sugar epimerase